MSTPSRKLNRFIYGTSRAGAAPIPQAEPDREPADRDLTPETRSAVDEALAKLKSVGGRR